MKLSGKTIVERSPEELSHLLLHPDELDEIPGCERLERHGHDGFRVILRLSWGLIKGRFRGLVRIREVKPQESYHFEMKAKGITGSIDAATSFCLASIEDGARTELVYEASGNVRGPVAIASQKLLRTLTPDVHEQFFRELFGK